MKLIDRFGSQPITSDMVTRLEKLTGRPAHRWLRRGYFFSHRGFDEVMDIHERKEEVCFCCVFDVFLQFV
jgi:tryptophanyl-tRNA synthetase